MGLKSVKSIYDIFIFSNLLIAFAASAQVLLTYYLLQIPINTEIVLLEGVATFLLYNFSLWLSMPKSTTNSPYQRTRWFLQNKGIVLGASCVALFFLVLCLSYLHIETLLLLVLGGALSIGYLFPVVHFKGKVWALRDIVGLKVFLIAFVWSISVVGMPVVEFVVAGGVINISSALYWLALVFIFFVGITLPFDLRDAHQDRVYNLKTIPVLFGEERTRVICYCLIIVHLIFLSLLPTFFIGNKIGLIILDLSVLSLFYIVLFRAHCDYKRVYLLDLALIIQLLFVLLFH